MNLQNYKTSGELEKDLKDKKKTRSKKAPKVVDPAVQDRVNQIVDIQQKSKIIQQRAQYMAKLTGRGSELIGEVLRLKQETKELLAILDQFKI